ncbi:hypothetical protein Taro_006713 [Colocasia esculenta]|uniref:Uncharacterized protein n=1 Tax=Colocasia esculenta TaxID=4460 RepID=A0A843TPE5_COLES|nr:hypothetical protein [Colocasia esculenta]
MVFSREVPRAVEVMTAAAAAATSSSPSPPPHRPGLLRGKPRSRLPVPGLKTWANQRLVRCVDGAGNNASPEPPEPPSTFSTSAPPSERERKPPGLPDDKFDEIREKLMDHLRKAAGRIELPAAASSVPAPAPGDETRQKGDHVAQAPVEDSDKDGSDSHAAAPAAATPSATVSVAVTPPPAAEELPWNLRTRRPASNGWHHASPDPPPARAASRLRSGAPERREATLRRRRPRFSLPLTKEEIDEDVYAFTGRLAARRPKKRPRAVQRQLDLLFPGMYLSEVTPDMYQVADPPAPPPS